MHILQASHTQAFRSHYTTLRSHFTKLQGPTGCNVLSSRYPHGLEPKSIAGLCSDGDTTGAIAMLEDRKAHLQRRKESRLAERKYDAWDSDSEEDDEDAHEQEPDTSTSVTDAAAGKADGAEPTAHPSSSADPACETDCSHAAAQNLEDPEYWQRLVQGRMSVGQGAVAGAMLAERQLEDDVPRMQGQLAADGYVQSAPLLEAAPLRAIVDAIKDLQVLTNRGTLRRNPTSV
eukprot:524044-Pyramimonas_sp.AAC.1